jgi:hypothetical protein
MVNPKTDARLFWKMVLKHICEISRVPVFIFFEVSLYTNFFLVEYFFKDFSSEAKLRISVPYLSSKNCAFPALRPTWKTETVGKSAFGYLIWFIWHIQEDFHIHGILFLSIPSKLKVFFWVLCTK